MKDDGTYTLQKQIRNTKGFLTVVDQGDTYEGTYSLDGDVLTLTWKEFKFPSCSSMARFTLTSLRSKPLKTRQTLKPAAPLWRLSAQKSSSLLTTLWPAKSSPAFRASGNIPATI